LEKKKDPVRGEGKIAPFLRRTKKPSLSGTGKVGKKDCFYRRRGREENFTPVRDVRRPLQNFPEGGKTRRKKKGGDGSEVGKTKP